MKRTIYTGTRLQEISFPLGGIGTGSVGLAGNGRLIDWDIFNRPNKGSVNGHTHFAVKAMQGDKLIDARILTGDVTTGLTGQHSAAAGHSGFGYGITNTSMQGFPHFRNCTFTGEFPLAEIALSDPDSLITAEIRAFNPFIPHNERDSSIPAAFFEITVTNNTGMTVEMTVSGTLANPRGESVNRYFEDGAVKGIYLDGAPLDKSSPDHADMTLALIADEVSYQENWYRGAWFDGLETYWRNFTETRRYAPRAYAEPGRCDPANLAAHKTVAPGERFTVRYAMAWYAPVKPDQWKWGEEEPQTVRNYYSYLFADSKAAAVYALTEWDRLYADTKLWHDELFASTLPEEVLDAVSATSSVLKTETSLRVNEAGDFWGWEGLSERAGSCHGTCTHVWNYAYTMAFLFPALERNIRENDYRYNQRESGSMCFRTRLPFGRNNGGMRACADGQFGGVIKTWREWKLCGDDAWLASIWPRVKKSLEFAWSEENTDRWDADKDGVLEGRQHHTLDMELFGPSSWLEGFYLGALKAGAEMAEAMGEPESAKEYLALFEKGKKWTAENLFNGEYFCQKVDLADKALIERFGAMNYWNDEAGQIKYQIGGGSIIDQMLAQWHADIIGLGELFDPAQVDTALRSMWKHNWKENMRSHYNTFRLFAVNDEAGAIICGYPEGAEKPAIPIPYAQESMHGFEYALAGLYISRGFIKEGLRIVKGVRDRYNGDNRNPWNEIECGNNYARSMASFALLPILSGMKFDMREGLLGFEPKTSKDSFRCVWSVGKAWGRVQIGEATEITVLCGALPLRKLALPYMEAKSVEVDGKAVGFTTVDGVIVLDAAVSVTKRILVK